MSDLVFIDTETTGLNPDRHQVWEIAYAVGLHGPIVSGVVSHTLRDADPAALKLNGYLDRYDRRPMLDETLLRAHLAGATLVASNPSFDRDFLRRRWGGEPWHHRSIAIETMAFALLDWDRPKGMAAIAEHFGLVAPDHSAAGDVHVLRACYLALRDLGTKR